MEAIKDTIRNIIEDLASKKINAGKDNPEALLKKLLTKKELKHIKCNYFKNGILGVSVDSSVWLYSFMLKKQKLLEILRQRFATLRDISFRIGKIK